MTLLLVRPKQYKRVALGRSAQAAANPGSFALLSGPDDADGGGGRLRSLAGFEGIGAGERIALRRFDDQRVARFLKAVNIRDGDLVGQIRDLGKRQLQLRFVYGDGAVELRDSRFRRWRRNDANGHLLLSVKFLVVDGLRDIHRENCRCFEC